MATSEAPKWKVTATKYLVDDRWLKLRAEQVVTLDGDVIDPWYVIEQADGVNCLVIDDADNVILLRHYRHGIRDYVPEIIGGLVEPKESPLETIRHELIEEIGYEGGTIYATGSAYVNPSNHTNMVYTFLAYGGACTAVPQREVGENFTIEKIAFKDFAKALTQPNISETYQSMHLAGIYFAFNFIRNGRRPELEHLRTLL